MALDEMALDEMALDEMALDEMALDKMALDKMALDDMAIHQKTATASMIHTVSVYFGKRRLIRKTSDGSMVQGGSVSISNFIVSSLQGNLC